MPLLVPPSFSAESVSSQHFLFPRFSQCQLPSLYEGHVSVRALSNPLFNSASCPAVAYPAFKTHPQARKVCARSSLSPSPMYLPLTLPTTVIQLQDSAVPGITFHFTENSLIIEVTFNSLPLVPAFRCPRGCHSKVPSSSRAFPHCSC